MPIEPYDVLMAAAQGRRAIRRGDLAAAERWFKLADRAASLAARLAELSRKDAARQRPHFNPAYS